MLSIYFVLICTISFLDHLCWLCYKEFVIKPMSMHSTFQKWTDYDSVCLLLGSGCFLVWFGILRYLMFFHSYSVSYTMKGGYCKRLFLSLHCTKSFHSDRFGFVEGAKLITYSGPSIDDTVLHLCYLYKEMCFQMDFHKLPVKIWVKIWHSKNQALYGDSRNLNI